MARWTIALLMSAVIFVVCAGGASARAFRWSLPGEDTATELEMAAEGFGENQGVGFPGTVRCNLSFRWGMRRFLRKEERVRVGAWQRIAFTNCRSGANNYTVTAQGTLWEYTFVRELEALPVVRGIRMKFSRVAVLIRGLIELNASAECRYVDETTFAEISFTELRTFSYRGELRLETQLGITRECPARIPISGSAETSRPVRIIGIN